MSSVDGKRAYRKDLLLACAMVAAGLVISGLSLAQLKVRHPQLAQATQPLQSSPTPAPQDNPPAESKPGGERPPPPAPGAGPPRYSAAEGGRYPSAPAATGREDCPADQGK